MCLNCECEFFSLETHYEQNFKFCNLIIQYPSPCVFRTIPVGPPHSLRSCQNHIPSSSIYREVEAGVF